MKMFGFYVYSNFLQLDFSNVQLLMQTAEDLTQFFSADHDFGPENDRQIVKTLKSYRSESCPSGWTVPPNTPVRAILRKMETTICQAVTAATQRAAALSTQNHRSVVVPAGLTQTAQFPLFIPSSSLKETYKADL